MLTVAANRFVPAALAMLLAMALLAAPAAARRQATSGDTVISNRAESTYRDDEGNEYGTVSPTVTVTVRPVSAITVTPDQTEPSDSVAQDERAARLFRVCNSGNTPDLYTLTRAEVSAPSALHSLHFDTDNSGTLTDADTPATLGSTLSPRLNPGACVGVIATVDVNGAATGSRLTIRLTARSNVTTTVNGAVSDDGTIVNAVGERARLTDPTNPALPPLKLVNERPRVTAAPAEQLDYSVAFRNSGSVTARNVLLADDLPAGIEYVAGSMRLGNRALTDAPDADEGRTGNNSRRLEVRISEVRAGEVVTLTFRARVTGDIQPGTGAVNVATVSGDNFESTGTTAATAVINPFGVVFAGRSGGSTQVAGARVSLLTAQTSDSPLATVPDIGFTPNEPNENPYTTKHGGTFSFALSPAQLGTSSSPAVYYLSVAAPGYRRRLIELTVRPTALGLYAATARALDEQQLAVAGGFALTEAEVSLDNLASVALNIPVFELQSLEIAKTADQQRAEIGDVVNYRVEVRNATQGTLRDLVVTDQLPVSFHYAPGTATLRVGADETRRLDPEVVGNTLTFRLPALPAGANASITYRVRVGANAREGDAVNSAVASGRYASGERVVTAPARATVRIGAGVFSTRQIIIGRVFVDANGNNEFDRGERAVAGARLYIDNGQSVVTDSEGLYNLPSVEDGSVVIALDPVTLPAGLMLSDGGQRSGRSWARLLRTPLGGGTLLRQNFALTRAEADALESTNAHAQPSTDDKPNGNAKPDGNDKTVGAGPVPAHSVAAADRDSSRANGNQDSSVVNVDSIPSMSALSRAGQGQALPRQKASAASQTAKNAATSQAQPGVVNAVAPRDENGAASRDEKVSGARIEKVTDARAPKADERAGKGDRAGRPSDAAPLAAGTYEVEATETLAAVAPGEVIVVSPSAGEVVMQPAMQVVVRVAKDWSAALEVNGSKVSEQNVGERRVDHRNNVSTFKFVGLSLRPGRNSVRASAVDPTGATAGKSVDFVVMGRGPARRIEIASEREEMQAGGRDSVLVRVRAFDEWGNPAADGTVGLSTTNGFFERVQPESTETLKDVGGSRFDAPDALASEQDRQPAQLALTLRNGEAVARLVSGGAVGQAELLAKLGEIEAEKRLRFTAELRPTILVGLAEASFGKAAPENALRGDDTNFRSHIEFFYRGPVLGKNLVTLAYDSQRSLNRTMGRDRLFQLDPLDRVYPVFGDSSTRFDEAESNSKLYARVDRGRSYAMFGDFEADMNEAALAGYARKLTGVKVHLENSRGDFLTLTGARPDTSFARDVFPASRLGLVSLTHTDVLQGSESVVLEVRDRRNPERIISREPLARSVDYNLDPLTGQIFFLRSISVFDYDLNLVQVVVTYEHRAAGMSSAVYTGRASKRFSRLGLRLGLSYVDQRQRELGSYRLGGLDGEQELWNRGSLKFEYANSRGELATAGNIFGSAGERHAGGSAYRLELVQPFELYEGTVRAEYARADEGFFNPFGATVAPGSRRLSAAVDLKPRRASAITFGFTNERNRTSNVDNERNTVSLGWKESFGEKLQLFAGYDYRHLSDAVSDHETNSHLLTVGAQYRPTDKVELSVKREQNLAEADPTFPDQTTIAARYRWSDSTSIFFTQRLASAPIVPISDTAQTGFSLTTSRRETAIGVETRLGKYTSVVSRYQLENGINGTDSFAVIGLQNRLPVSKAFALDLGFEHGFHVAGLGQSFTAGAFGVSYLPTKDLRTSARYELRDQQGGLGQILTLGAAGRVGDNLTTLARFQWARTHFAGRESETMLGTAAVAWRPLNSDRHAVLFSYTRRELSQSGFEGRAGSAERADILSTDAFWQPLKDTELFGRFALKFGRDAREGLLPAEALTYVSQLRIQRRLRRAFDVAAEARMLSQPSTRTRRTSVGTEFGYWILPDIRLGIGYNFTAADEPAGSLVPAPPRGWYFTVSTKLSSLFDLFGTSADGLAPSTTSTTSTAPATANDKQPADAKADAPPADAPPPDKP